MVFRWQSVNVAFLCGFDGVSTSNRGSKLLRMFLKHLGNFCGKIFFRHQELIFHTKCILKKRHFLGGFFARNFRKTFIKWPIIVSAAQYFSKNVVWYLSGIILNGFENKKFCGEIFFLKVERISAKNVPFKKWKVHVLADPYLCTRACNSDETLPGWSTIEYPNLVDFGWNLFSSCQDMTMTKPWNPLFGVVPVSD